MLKENNRNPWDRIIGKSRKEVTESFKAYEAFCVYRDMPYRASKPKPHCLADTARELKKAYQTVYRWYNRWNWVDRTLAYDEYMEGIRREEQEVHFREMEKRHIALSQLMQNKGLQALQATNIKEVSPTVAMNLVSNGITLERQSVGASTSKQEVVMSGSVGTVPDEENLAKILGSEAFIEFNSKIQNDIIKPSPKNRNH